MDQKIEEILIDYYNKAVAHRDEDRCGGYPYDEYHKLFSLIQEGNIKTVLEVGTGIGFSAAVMAFAGAERVDTIERKQSHIDEANKICTSLGLGEKVKAHKGKAHLVLPQFPSDFYDAVFFDGYAPQYSQGIEFYRCLKKGALLISANSHLEGAYKESYMDFLEEKDKWEFMESFEDTKIYKKK